MPCVVCRAGNVPGGSDSRRAPGTAGADDQRHGGILQTRRHHAAVFRRRTAAAVHRPRRRPTRATEDQLATDAALETAMTRCTPRSALRGGGALVLALLGLASPALAQSALPDLNIEDLM